VINRIHAQSAEIAQGVDASTNKDEGAGDQGLMFGYATNETATLMPAPIHYAHRILHNLARRRHGGDTRLGPDAKSQLTVAYENGKPTHVQTLLVSHQHTAQTSHDDLLTLVKTVAAEELPKGWLTDKTRILINPTGSFVQGGPGADTGLTGRKIIVDTYGGMSRHGGGAFSGKDPTKVDRSAAYAARYLAKNIVAADLADCCEIQLCYAIGVAEPLAIYLDTFGTVKGNLTEDHIVKAIGKTISLTPRGIREHLQLNRPIYSPTAAYGHFGRDAEGGLFPWEKTDLVDRLVAAL
jgi:S-adenosylmethionine synthetase